MNDHAAPSSSGFDVLNFSGSSIEMGGGTPGGSKFGDEIEVRRDGQYVHRQRSVHLHVLRSVWRPSADLFVRSVCSQTASRRSNHAASSPCIEGRPRIGPLSLPLDAISFVPCRDGRVLISRGHGFAFARNPPLSQRLALDPFTFSPSSPLPLMCFPSMPFLIAAPSLPLCAHRFPSHLPFRLASISSLRCQS